MPYGTVSADIIQSSVTGVSLGAGNATVFKNRIINGDMRIDQRNAGASQTTSTTSTYMVDRWYNSNSQNTKYTVQQNAGSVTPPTGFINYQGATSTSAYTVGSSDYFFIAQAIEGLNVADLGFGTANAKTVTLSAWVYSSLTGTFGGSLRNSAANRSYPFSYTISSANTWTQISITIAGDTSGTWLTTNGIGILVSFSLGMGSTFSTTAGAWAAGNYASATGATNVVSTSGATFYITGVQLEVGSSATGFEYVDYTTQLAMCQRYYWKTFPQSVAPAQNSGTLVGTIYYICIIAGANYMGAPVFFPVVMRATPTTLTYYNVSAANAKWRNTSTGADSGNAVAPGNLSQYGFLAINNPQVAGDGLNNSIFIHATADAEL